MARVYTNRCLLRAFDGGFAAATKNLVAVKGTAPSAATIKDYNFLSDLITGAVTEAAASTYARAAVTATPAEDDTNDRATMTYSTVTLATAAPSGETWTMIACINTAGGADSARELYWVDILGTAFVTNGSGAQYNPTAVDPLTAA